MEDMIKMMADAPEEERKQMMTDRLKMFASMPEDQRVESISGLITGFSKLPPDKREELIAGRTMIIANLSEDERRAIMVGRMKAGMKVGPEIHESDMALTEKAAMGLPDDQKMGFMASMDAVKSEMGGMMEKDVDTAMEKIGGAPEHHGKPMQLKGVFSKKYVCSVCGYKQAA
ncbi:MAG: hypothetical protein V3W28_00685 [Thermoplasmata archaeon]